MKTVAIIEDQTAIREMLIEAALNSDQFEVILQSGDGLLGCQQCLELKPDFVILDIRLPGLNGLEVMRRLSRTIPETRVLVFSAYPSAGLLHELLQAGALGFVEKSAPLSELKLGIQIVSNGGSYFGPEAARLLREALAAPRGNGSINKLTKREREILQLIAASHSTRAIAAKLHISFKTAENHRSNLMRKLDLHDIAGLTRYAIHNGLLPIDTP